MLDNISSIRSVIDKAYDASKNIDIVNHIYNNYSIFDLSVVIFEVGDA